MSLPLGWKFIQAAKAAQVEEILSLLKHNPSLDVNWEDYHGWTAFHYACIGNHVEVVKLLLGFPHLNVNVQDHSGQTPVLQVCEYGQLPVVKLLLKDPRVDVALHSGGQQYTGTMKSWKGLLHPEEAQLLERFIANPA